jgi:hypothetical protein
VNETFQAIDFWVVELFDTLGGTDTVTMGNTGANLSPDPGGVDDRGSGSKRVPICYQTPRPVIMCIWDVRSIRHSCSNCLACQ